MNSEIVTDAARANLDGSVPFPEHCGVTLQGHAMDEFEIRET